MSGIVNSTGAVSGVIGTTVGTPAAGGGITHTSQWRLSTSLSSQSGAITSNLVIVPTTRGYGTIGAVMTVASGIFTFPATGHWLVTGTFSAEADAGRGFCNIGVFCTLDNSSYNQATESLTALEVGDGSGNGYASATTTYQFDVQATTTHKCKFQVAAAYPGEAVSWIGNAAVSYTHFNFTRFGDT